MVNETAERVGSMRYRLAGGTAVMAGAVWVLVMVDSVTGWPDRHIGW